MADSMQRVSDTAVIPPVRTGIVESRIDFEYDEQAFGDGGFEATSEHRWTFDAIEYAQQTDLDIGGDDPYVAQANGHTLRLVTDYTWRQSDFHSSTYYTLDVEQRAVRGTSRTQDIFFTRAGYYRLDDSKQIVTVEKSDQPYVVREHVDEHVDHYPPHPLGGHTVDSGEELVRQLHGGTVCPSVLAKLHDLLVADSPEDAITVHSYENRDGSETGETTDEDTSGETTPSSAD